MREKIFSHPTQPVDVLNDPVGLVVKTPEGRYSAKQAAAVIFVSNQLANGVSMSDSLRSAQQILHQSGRKKIGALLESARSLRQKNN